MLSKLFKGRLGALSTAERKLADIETLSSANPEQLSRLRELSEDGDASVRLAAARRIGLRDQLCKMLVRETDADVRLELVNDLFNQVNTADEHEIAALLVRHTRDASAQRQLVFELTAARAVATLIQQSEEASLALDVASGHRVAAVRLAAAKLIDEPDALHHLARTSRDKSVQQLVRMRQRELKAEQHANKEAAQRVDKLISASARLVDSPDTVDYAARLQVLQQQLEDVADLINDDQRHVVERNLHRCRQRAASLQPADARMTVAETSRQRAAGSGPEALEPQPVQPHQMPATERTAAEQLLQSLEAELDTLDFHNASALDNFSSTLANRRDALQLGSVDGDIEQRFSDLANTCQVARTCLAKLDLHEASMSAFLATDVNSELGRAEIAAQQDQLAVWLAELDWPASRPQPSAISDLIAKGNALSDELKRRDTDRQATERKLDRLIHRLRGQVQRKQLKGALYAERSINELLEGLDTKTRGETERKLSAPLSALQQLRDWEDFSARPKREELAEKMEALQRNPLSPDAQAEAVKSLRQTWRSVGTVPLKEDDPLRERFTAAAEAAFAHCADWHERQQELRTKNLAERARLVTELRAFVDAVDWANPDLDVLSRALRASRDEWWHYYPVRHSDARDCQREFDALAHRINKAIKKGQADNAKAREKLIAEAEALADTEDLEHAIQRAIVLQNEWKTVGQVAAKQQRQQWKRFREPMDALFARRTAIRDSAKAESDAKLSAARDALAELRALAADTSQSLAQRTRAAEDIVASLTPQLEVLPAKERKAIEHKVAECIGALQQAERDAPRQRRIARLHALAEVASECAELELQHHDAETVDASALRATLDERLGENTTARALIDERIRALSEPWSSSHAEQQTEQLSAALVEMEILADLPTPDAWRAERRACQIEMLEDHMGAAGDAGESLYSLCERALATGPISGDAQSLDADRRLQAILAAAPKWLPKR